MWIADNWKDYEVIDCSNGEKLERWGDYLLVRPDPQVHGGADVRVRDGIPVASIGDVAVGLNPPAVHPVHHLVCHRRQRDQQRLLLAFEHRQT